MGFSCAERKISSLYSLALLRKDLRSIILQKRITMGPFLCVCNSNPSKVKWQRINTSQVRRDTFCPLNTLPFADCHNVDDSPIWSGFALMDSGRGWILRIRLSAMLAEFCWFASASFSVPWKQENDVIFCSINHSWVLCGISSNKEV